MAGKVVFITGAASGIGKQIGESFLKEGDKVVLSVWVFLFIHLCSFMLDVARFYYEI